MYWIAYNTETNAFLGISDNSMAPQEGVTIQQFDGDMPDLSRWAWNSSTLSWYEKTKRVLTKLQFMKRLQPDEYAAIKAATLVSNQVDFYWQLFMLAEFIDLQDETTITGLNALESIGLLSAGRAAELLSY